VGALDDGVLADLRTGIAGGGQQKTIERRTEDLIAHEDARSSGEDTSNGSTSP
jgi:hypothetical protein